MRIVAGRISGRIECLQPRLRFRLQRDPHLPFSFLLCSQAQKKGSDKMNDTTNKEKQFDAAGKRRIVIDGIPYTVKVFFQSDLKNTLEDKLSRLVRHELENDLVRER